MAGKKAKGGGKKGGGKKGGEAEARRRAEAVDDIEGEEYKTNLMLELHQLQQETETEQRFASLYQQERESINYFWMAEKKHLEDTRADQRNKEWSLQELKEKHDIEIKVCKQRVKHLLFNNLDNLVDQKTQAEAALKIDEDDHRYKQRELKYDVRALKVQEKEKEVNHEEYLRALKKEEDKKKMELRYEFERNAIDLKNKYTAKMGRLRTRMEDQKKRIIEQIENKMSQAIKDLTRMHQQKLLNIQAFYKNITEANISNLTKLQQQVVQLRILQVSDSRTLNKLEYEKKHFKNPKKEAKAKVIQLTKKLEQYQKEKSDLHSVFEKITAIQQEIRTWTWEYQVLLQQHQYVTKQRDEIYNKFQDSILQVQQKVGLKNLILEKKLETIQETIEAKDVQLHQLLAASNLAPNTIAQVNASLQEVENVKNEKIAEIQAELRRIREAHSNMVKTYEGKLFEFGIPVEELGFDPLVPANT